MNGGDAKKKNKITNVKNVISPTVCDGFMEIFINPVGFVVLFFFNYIVYIVFV